MEAPTVELQAEDLRLAIEARLDHFQHARFAGAPIAMHTNGHWLIGSVPQKFYDGCCDRLVIEKVDLSLVVRQDHWPAPPPQLPQPKEPLLAAATHSGS